MPSEALGLLRFAAGLPRFLANPVSPDQTADIVERGMARREDAFVEKVRSAVFDNPRSPYLPLLRAAGCELGDLARMVHQRGLESTLERLRQAGVYVTYDEFKARVPIVRSTITLPVRDEDFDNPMVVRHFASTTGGTRGRARRIMIDLDHLAQMAPHWALWFWSTVSRPPLWSSSVRRTRQSSTKS